MQKREGTVISFSLKTWKKVELVAIVLLLIGFLKLGVDLIDISNEQSVRVTKLGQFLVDIGVPPHRLEIVICKAGDVMVTISLCLGLLLFFSIVHNIALTIIHKLK
jgi:hypothetical protein